MDTTFKSVALGIWTVLMVCSIYFVNSITFFPSNEIKTVAYGLVMLIYLPFLSYFVFD